MTGHAYVRNGVVHVMLGGVFIADTRLCWSEWLIASQSPIPTTQERARELRAALDEVGYLQELAA